MPPGTSDERGRSSRSSGHAPFNVDSHHGLGGGGQISWFKLYWDIILIFMYTHKIRDFDPKHNHWI